MDSDISVKVSREGNITMIVPELENKLTSEKASLLAGLLKGAIEDGKELSEGWARGSAILKPYNSTGRKISEVAFKVRSILEGEPTPEGVIDGEAA
jgi:hypothetical protein